MPNDLTLATTVPTDGPARTRLRTALLSLEANQLAEARGHLLAALEFHPAASEILIEMLAACADNPDLLAQYAERFVRAACDERGRFKPNRDQKKRLSKMRFAKAPIEAAVELTSKRNAAVQELARYIDKLKPKGARAAENALLTRWASEALLHVAEHTPASLGKAADKVRARQESFAPDYDRIYAALAKLMRLEGGGAVAEDSKTPTTGAPSAPDAVDDLRVRAARLLAGLARQSSYDDLKGPPAQGPGRLGDDARKLLEEERQLDLQSQVIWSIAKLEAMSEEEALRFTEEHDDWHNPGLALSETGRYRVETTCGYHTLLGVARSVELHHNRLVSHYGKDPFEGRQGVVRVVPEDHGLETEGAPHWWAGGFQGGDRTTVRFAWGKISGLGRTLTHELTHRFDGTLRPFLPSWYVEGHADWTGGHYAKMTDREFLQDWLKLGALSTTYYRGYSRPNNFDKLLKGEVEDYRHNYFAGYSLYAFLRSYPPKAPRYQAALPKYERNARAGQKDPVGYFTATFCDGKEGRPETLEELLEEWREFTLAGYDWGNRDKQAAHPWVNEYRRGRGPGDGDPMVMDEPTWSWARTRAEPFFGQDHASLACLLLAEAGEHDAAIAAGVWSLKVDGWRPDVSRALLRSLTSGKSKAAPAFAALAHGHFDELSTLPGSDLLNALPKLAAFLKAMAARAQELAANSAPASAAALAREHARLAKALALPPLAQATASAAARNPRHLGASGFTESELLNFDERREAGLWYVTDTGDLHVGRNKPRESTGVLDRKSRQVHAFAHSVEWLEPGHYVLRGRIHWTTSYVSGAIVIGHTRRDRGIRIGFSAGDFAYAVGRSEQNDAGKVRLSLKGMWERDGQLRSGNTRVSVDVPNRQNWFAYELHVRGPRIEVVAAGETLMRYAVHDGAPIEGPIGFAVRQGAIRVQQPTVQRLDNEITSPIVGLDVQQQPTATLEELTNLQTRGIPNHHDGTIVLWLPTVDEGSPAGRLGRAIRPLSRILQADIEYPQPWVLCVPKGMDQDEKDRVLEDLRDLRPGEWPIVEHQIRAPFESKYPWILFLDGQGVLRAASDSRNAKVVVRLGNWARKYRGRGNGR
ncbi:MAG: hypothetical protein AB8H80_20415 [Planctomycetota bacterium]